jgi:hypothetical protein
VVQTDPHYQVATGTAMPQAQGRGGAVVSTRSTPRLRCSAKTVIEAPWANSGSDGSMPWWLRPNRKADLGAGLAVEFAKRSRRRSSHGRIKMEDNDIRAALDRHWAASDANPF